MDGRVPVTFLPSGSTGWVEPGSTVLEAARVAGVAIAAPCGGRGVCGACGVRVRAGELAAPDAQEGIGLSRAPAHIRLACRARVVGPVTVHPIVSLRGSSIRAVGPSTDAVIAVDLGTTNVVASAFDIATGEEIGRATVANRQSTYGADVLARVGAAIADPSDAERLTRAARDSVREALEATGVELRHVQGGVVAGNTVMSALLAGADVSGLGAHPFIVPVIPRTVKATALGGAFDSHVDLSLVPALSGFVGGDVTAGLIGTGLTASAATMMLVDVGTNAEIVLAHAGSYHIASAAAGPAFDGGGISCGGPVVDGAIVTVREDDGRLAAVVHGDAPPAWFGGSGLVSLIARLVASGDIAPDGRMTRAGRFADLFSVDDAGVLRICPFPAARHVCLSQLDVRGIQLAKAAIRTGIDIVLRSAGVTASEVEGVVVAGAFGRALDPRDLVGIGMVPPAFGAIMTAAGNTSLAGAISMALDPRLAEQVGHLQERVRPVDLVTAEGFNEALLAATAFPSG